MKKVELELIKAILDNLPYLDVIRIKWSSELQEYLDRIPRFNYEIRDNEIVFDANYVIRNYLLKVLSQAINQAGYEAMENRLQDG